MPDDNFFDAEKSVPVPLEPWGEEAPFATSEDDYGDRRVIQLPGTQRAPVNPDDIIRWREDGWVEAELPIRPWIARGYLMRSAVTVIGGAGAAGKSMLILGYGVALVLGNAWGRFEPNAPCKVCIVNAEDDDDEQRLRLSAVLRQHGATPDQIAGRLARVSLPTGARLVHYDPASGRAVATDAMHLLETHLERFQPDVLALDPIVELHDAPENDNVAFAAAVSILRALARKYSCSLILAHHVRKGSADGAGDPDILRGAGSLVGLARIVLTVCVMTKTEAEALTIEPDQRRFFFRVDDAKGNYAPPAAAAWFERVEYQLDNSETAPAAVPWHPPSDAISMDQYQDLLRFIATANPPLSPKLDRHDRSFRHVCVRLGITTTAGQTEALSRLQTDHGVVIADFSRPGKSLNDTRKGLRTADFQPDSVHWKDTPDE